MTEICPTCARSESKIISTELQDSVYKNPAYGALLQIFQGERNVAPNIQILFVLAKKKFIGKTNRIFSHHYDFCHNCSCPHHHNHHRHKFSKIIYFTM